MGMPQQKNEYTEDGFFTADLAAADAEVFKAIKQSWCASRTRSN
jgi:hypothetical protein